MTTPALDASLAWLLAFQALALGTGLKGACLLPRRSPRWLWPALALASGALFAGFARAPGDGWPLWLGVGFLAAAAASLGLRALAPLRPDAPFLPAAAGPRPARWEPRELEVQGEVDARALLLEPASPPAVGRGAVVVFSHGGGNDRLYGLWELFPPLLERGHAILTANLAGHGRGGRDLFSLEAARRRLDALVEAAEERARGRAIVLMGQSMGASLALDALARGVPMAAAVSISAPVSLAIDFGVAFEAVSFLHRPIYRSLRHGTLAELLPAVGSFKRESTPVRVPHGTTYIEAFASLLSRADLPARLRSRPSPATPVMVVHGTSDHIVPVANARRVVEALGGAASPFLAPKRTHLDILFDSVVVGAIADFVDARAGAVRREFGSGPSSNS